MNLIDLIKKELWDSKRFLHCHGYGKHKKWTLPTFCLGQSCKYVISSSEVEEEPFIPGSRLKNLRCPLCHKAFIHEPVDPGMLHISFIGIVSSDFLEKRILGLVL